MPYKFPWGCVSSILVSKKLWFFICQSPSSFYSSFLWEQDLMFEWEGVSSQWTP
jgi:hypothetical protein